MTSHKSVAFARHVEHCVDMVANMRCAALDYCDKPVTVFCGHPDTGEWYCSEHAEEWSKRDIAASAERARFERGASLVYEPPHNPEANQAFGCGRDMTSHKSVAFARHVEHCVDMANDVEMHGGILAGSGVGRSVVCCLCDKPAVLFCGHPDTGEWYCAEHADNWQKCYGIGPDNWQKCYGIGPTPGETGHKLDVQAYERVAGVKHDSGKLSTHLLPGVFLAAVFSRMYVPFGGDGATDPELATIAIEGVGGFLDGEDIVALWGAFGACMQMLDCGGKMPFPHGWAEIVRVLEFGAQKYAPNNWRKGIVHSRTLGAALRHLMFGTLAGEPNDPETGLPHAAHAACEIMFAITFELENRKDLDDRYLGEAG